MSGKKRLVLFVEGDGDLEAVPVLIKRLLTEHSAWDVIELDTQPFKTKGIHKLLSIQAGRSNWERWLLAACKRENLGAVLLLVDGDAEKIGGRKFCAAEVTKELSRKASQAGAGRVFSVATVFAIQEFETWIIAVIDSLKGNLPDGRPGVKPDAVSPSGNLEEHPRNAKGWLSENMVKGYKPSQDQKPLTEKLDLGLLRKKNLRSFAHLENSLKKIIAAARKGECVF